MSMQSSDPTRDDLHEEARTGQDQQSRPRTEPLTDPEGSPAPLQDDSRSSHADAPVVGDETRADQTRRQDDEGTLTSDVDGPPTDDVDGTRTDDVDGTRTDDVDGTRTDDVRRDDEPWAASDTAPQAEDAWTAQSGVPPTDEPLAADGGAGAAAGTAAGGDALLGDDADFSRRWDEVQTTFVDDPHQAVNAAGALVEDVLARLSDTFSAERGRSEAGDHDGDETEQLRVAMQRYREFFRRLLAV